MIATLYLTIMMRWTVQTKRYITCYQSGLRFLCGDTKNTVVPRHYQCGAVTSGRCRTTWIMTGNDTGVRNSVTGTEVIGKTNNSWFSTVLPVKDQQRVYQRLMGLTKETRHEFGASRACAGVGGNNVCLEGESPTHVSCKRD
jgi:hypothetical protein